jgi:hypothetical protein
MKMEAKKGQAFPKDFLKHIPNGQHIHAVHGAKVKKPK